MGSFSAQAGDKTFNFDSDPSSVLDFFGTSVWVSTGGNPASGGYLEVTKALGSQKGTIIFDDFDNGLIVKAFTFSMDLKIGDGTTDPADGFSINYCSADDPVVVAHDGNGWAASPGNEANLPEEGTQTGLGVGFDAWNSGSGDIIGISVRVDNRLLTQIPMPTKNGAADDATSLQTGPRANGDGLGAGLTWQPLKLVLKEDATIDVFWKNKQIVTNLSTTFFPRAGRIVFGGRTGGSHQLQAVDNIRITTVAAANPLIAGLSGTADGFRLIVNDAPGNPLVTNSLTAKLDGKAVTFKSIVTDQGSNIFTMAGFPTLLPSGKTLPLEVNYVDSQGKTTVYTNKTITVPVYNTIDAAGTVAASTVDKAAVGFVADVVQANSIATLINTAERAEYQLQGELMNGSVPFANVAKPGPFSVDGILNWNRDANAIGAEIGAFQAPTWPDAAIPGVDGAWQTDVNLTHGFDNVAAEVTGVLDLKKGVYTFGVNSDDGFRFTLGASQFNVLNKTYGIFEGGKGSSDVLFTVVANDDGLYPMRLVWYQGNGGANLEFFTVLADGTRVPVNDTAGDFAASAIKCYKATTAVIPPFVQLASPMPDVTGVSPLAPVKVELSDGASATINKDSVKLSVNGADVTTAPTTTVTKSGKLTQVVYAPTVLYPQNSNITAVVTFTDSASKSYTNAWTFTTLSGAVAVPDTFALDGTSGLDSGFDVRLVHTTTGATTSIAWNEDLLAGNGTQGATINMRAYEAASVVNYLGNGGVGNFANPTINLPGANGVDLDNFAMEMIAYVQLDRGVYRFGVNSDDGFDLTFGAEPHAKTTRVTSFDGGRGVTDTDGVFIINKAGLYPMRLMFFEGGGGDACELYYKDDSGVRSLINDSTGAKYIKAFRHSSALTTTIAFNTQPSNTTLFAFQPLTLKVAVSCPVTSNANLYCYQWKKGGEALDGETAATLYRQFASPDDAGTYTCDVTLLGYKPVTSAAAVVTVNSDTNPPKVVAAKGGASFKTVKVTFDRYVDPDTALIAANYSIPGLTISSTVVPVLVNATNVILVTSEQTKGKTYTVTVTGVKNGSGVVIAGNNTANFSGFTEAKGFATLEFFDGVTGGTVASVTAAEKFLNNLPDRLQANNTFQTLSWANGDNYGGRATAIVTAPATGNYTFYIASDDNSALFLSTDENPVDVLTATPICQVTSVSGGWTDQRQWTKNAEQKSLPQALVAGQRYFVTAIWADGTGGDGVAVGWTKPSEAATTINVLPSEVLSGFLDPIASTITVSQQPTNLTVLQNRPATFSVTAAGTSDWGTTVAYQWKRGDADITNATGSSYTIPFAQLADNGATFKVVMSVPGKTITSDVATLTVNADTVLPQLVIAGARGAEGTNVVVVFDEMVDAATATNVANYTIAGTTVTNAVLNGNGLEVTLTLSSVIAKGASVAVAGVKDMALNAVSGTLAIAFGDDVTTPGDKIVGSSTNTPGAETVDKTIDNLTTTKYLNFDKLNTGFTVTPTNGASTIIGIGLTSANDSQPRDPASYKIEGSNDGTTFTVIATGTVGAFSGRYVRQDFYFPNTAAYTVYRVTFPTVYNAASANSMQIGEVELLGTLGGGVEKPTLSFVKNGANLVLTFTGRLQASDTVNGTYSDVNGATSPATIPMSGQKFYRAAK